MNPELYTKIQTKLRAYLRREPTEKEILNGQTDSTLINWVTQDDQKKLADDQKTLTIDLASTKIQLEQLDTTALSNGGTIPTKI